MKTPRTSPPSLPKCTTSSRKAAEPSVSKKTLLALANSVLKQVHTSPDRVEVLYKTPTHLKHLKRDPLLEAFTNHLLQTENLDRPVRPRQKPLKIKVAWNPNLRTTAGMAFTSEKLIVLNPKLIHISPGEVQRTLRHEIAHILAQYRAGRKTIQAHGKEWQKACADLGIPNESAFHTLDGPFKSRRLKPKFFYSCPNCENLVKRVIPIKYRAACIHCCEKYAKGKYSERFRLQLNLSLPKLFQKAA